MSFKKLMKDAIIFSANNFHQHFKSLDLEGLGILFSLIIQKTQNRITKRYLNLNEQGKSFQSCYARWKRDYTLIPSRRIFIYTFFYGEMERGKDENGWSVRRWRGYIEMDGYDGIPDTDFCCRLREAD